MQKINRDLIQSRERNENNRGREEEVVTVEAEASKATGEDLHAKQIPIIENWLPTVLKLI